MRRFIIPMCLALVPVLPVDRASGLNLLLNPSFELPETTANTVLWFGDYRVYSVPNAFGPRSHVPTPAHVDGEWGYELSDGSPVDGADSVYIVQSLPVTPGASVTFTGSFHAEVTGAPATAEVSITLWDGPAHGGANIGQAFVSPATPADNGSWVTIQLGNVADSGTVTIQIEAVVNSPVYNNVAAVHMDAFSLTSDVPCGFPHTLDTISVSSGPHNADVQDVVLTGSGMLGVDAVRLIDIADETALEAMITSQSSTSVTVDLPTSGAPFGLYNVVAEQADCTSQVLVDAFEVICGNPTVITGIDPPSLTQPVSGSVQFTLSGANLDQINTLTLDGMWDIPGTINGSVGNELLVTFDMTGVPFGPYDVVATRPDTCYPPAPLVKGFELLPPPGVNLLVNGGFEAEGQKGQDSAPMGSWANSLGGPGPKYDGSLHRPQPLGEPGGANQTNNRGSVDVGTQLPSWAGIFQQVAVTPGQPLDLRGFLAGGTTVGAAHKHWVRIRDGGLTGPVIGLFEEEGDFTWIPFDYRAVPSQSTIAVEWGFGAGSGGGWGIVATHVDELRLVEVASACNDPFADADGDGDVDQDDFAIWQLCHTGPGGVLPVGPVQCVCYDVEGAQGEPDGDVDFNDFQTFQLCASGPMVPADINCDD